MEKGNFPPYYNKKLLALTNDVQTDQKQIRYVMKNARDRQGEAPQAQKPAKGQSSSRTSKTKSSATSNIKSNIKSNPKSSANPNPNSAAKSKRNFADRAPAGGPRKSSSPQKNAREDFERLDALYNELALLDS